MDHEIWLRLAGLEEAVRELQDKVFPEKVKDEKEEKKK